MTTFYFAILSHFHNGHEGPAQIIRAYKTNKGWYGTLFGKTDSLQTIIPAWLTQLCIIVNYSP